MHRAPGALKMLNPTTPQPNSCTLWLFQTNTHLNQGLRRMTEMETFIAVAAGFSWYFCEVGFCLFKFVLFWGGGGFDS